MVNISDDLNQTVSHNMSPKVTANVKRKIDVFGQKNRMMDPRRKQSGTAVGGSRAKRDIQQLSLQFGDISTVPRSKINFNSNPFQTPQNGDSLKVPMSVNRNERSSMAETTYLPGIYNGK